MTLLMEKTNALTPTQKKRNGFVLWKSSMSSLSFRYFIYRPKIYALAIPQFGPGRTRRMDPYTRDVGRMGKVITLKICINSKHLL